MDLLFILGSRGEWGYIQPVIDLAQSRGHKCHIWACNMSVLPEYGNLVKDIDPNKYNIVHRAFTAVSGDSTAALTRSFGLTAIAFSDFLQNSKYDWLICAGDRLEQLAVVTVAFGQGTAVAHIQAGERSGNIDGMTRHAMARFVHLHFASNEDAAQRLVRTGESPSRVYVTGAPQLDAIKDELPTIEELVQRQVCYAEDFILAVLHGVTDEEAEIVEQVETLLSVLKDQPMPIVWVGSNNDTSGDTMRKLITGSLRLKDKFFVNLNRLDYLAILQNCRLMIGNSSSALLEAPSFGVPVVNIGSRQRDRVRAKNVIDALFSRDDIEAAMNKALSEEFNYVAKSSVNPYGDGQSSLTIVELLETFERTPEFMKKQIEF
jgi:GDP/UDP-N,N'-diacetylbacillosamine 2-epimerase (hydrolysing)